MQKFQKQTPPSKNVGILKKNIITNISLNSNKNAKFIKQNPSSLFSS